MKAFSMIRPGPEYRREAFDAGLAALGFAVTMGWSGQPIGRDDVLVIWNRYGAGDDIAARFERAGARVIVAENGYLGVDRDGHQLYALALNHHSGFGVWHVGREDRFTRLGVTPAPWRALAAGPIIVCGQRGFGTAGPQAGWHDQVARRLREVTQRQIIVRPHPRSAEGRDQPPLAGVLRGAHAVVIWTSASGVHALLAGVPVICAAPHWVCRSAALCDFAAIDNPPPLDRRAAFHALGWAQWTLDEIAAGLPFKHLLRACDARVGVAAGVAAEIEAA